jgi:exodeoxyribonuclease V alpha subunit
MPDYLPFQKHSQPTVEIQGVLDRLTFYNKENGYTIARLQKCIEGSAGQRKEMVTAVGYFADAPVGSTLGLSGYWHEDPKYGRQFNVEHYTILKPNTINGIERYLGSGLIPGIGTKFAERIVARFGLDTLEILDHDAERLHEVEGLGRKRVKQIKIAWQEQKAIHAVMVFLQAHSISAAYAIKIYKTYGQNALSVVKENPYRLAEDVWGIGFRIADTIAQSLGVAANDERRLRAGVLFALKEASKQGHCFIEKPNLQDLAFRLLKLSDRAKEGIAAHLQALVQENKIINDEDRIYLVPLFYAEAGVGTRLCELQQSDGGFAPLVSGSRQSVINEINARMAISLSDEQLEAIIMALTSKVGVLTGGPGTGKSTILKGLILLLEKNGITFRLAAPTGRAAKRLAETCDREASTIHRLLEFDPKIMAFKRNGANPVEAEMVIVDEASMLDILLANALLKAVPSSASLLLVGDADQLPSVGPGNVLRDIIKSKTIPVVHLNRIYRQGEGSLISINAALVNDGQPLDLQPEYTGEKDFYCIFREDQAEIEKEIISLCTGRLTKKFGYDPVRDIQVLAPMYKGLVGCEHLNVALQENLNRGMKSGVKENSRFQLGDKVMQIRNNYDKEVFNGDLGIVVQVDTETQELWVSFENRRIRFESNEQDELVLAYAVTVHKSQGSEFPCVIMPVHSAHYLMLQRNLLYTAITRGKQLVILIGSNKAINMAIKNNRQQKRNTFLKEKLATEAQLFKG